MVFSLPAGVALGGVDAQHVRARGQQGRDALLIVARVDARADEIALLIVEQLERVLLMGGVVLAEHEVQQVAVGVHNGQGVELMLPDDVVCFLQRRLRWRGDELFQRRRERADLLAAVHAETR